MNYSEDIENGPPSAKRRRKTTSPSRPTSSGSAAGNHTVALPYASFLSPTKASLARFNPGLLPPPRRRSRASKSLSPVRVPDSSENTAPDRLSYVLGDKLQNANKDASYEEQRENEERMQEEEQADITPGKSSRNILSEAINSGGAVAVTPTSIRNSGLTKSDDVFAPTPEQQVSSKRSMENEENEEDDLPETPEKMLQQAKKLTPRGILYHSTPRRRKQRELDRQMQDTTSKEKNSEDRSDPAPIVEESQRKVDSGLSNELSSPRKELANGNNEEHSLELEVFAESELENLKKKREELDTIQKQILVLKTDMRDMRKQLKKMDVHVLDRKYSDINDLVTLINRTNQEDSEKPIQPPTSSLLASFLPFSIPVLNSLDVDMEDTNPLPSHTPLPDTPQLINLFTPLTVSSHLLQPTNSDDSSISQTHSITFSSPGDLLRATFDMTISSSPEPSHTSIESLSIANLSHWAGPELGAWLDQKASENDVPSVGYALGRYWDVCTRRAKCWTRTRLAFPHLLNKSSEFQNLNSRKRKRVDSELANQEEFVLEDVVGDLGRQVIKFQNAHVSFRVSWIVELDWAGDVVSKVGARAAFPSSWSDTDERNSLKTVPAVFDQLVGKHGVFTAIKVMIGLLFGDSNKE